MSEDTLSERRHVARSILFRSLGWEDIDPDLHLFDYGLVSVQATALLAVIQQIIGEPPPRDLLITHPSLNELAVFVSQTQTPGRDNCVPPLGYLGEVPLRGDRSIGTYSIRRATVEDASDLATLDEESWPAPLQGFTIDEVRRRVRRFQAGQFVLCDPNGSIVGSLYTQRIASTEKLSLVTDFHQSLDLHRDNGPIWQLISVQVHPSLASRGLGDMLINYALTVARASAGVNRVIAMTRSRTWADARKQNPSLSLQDHIKHGTDPGLVFHTARGAEITSIIAGWRPEDMDNLSNGILVEYDLSNFRLICDKPLPRSNLQDISAISSRQALRVHSSTSQLTQILDRVSKLVETYVDSKINIDLPLMTAGLDSYSMQSFIKVALEPRGLTHYTLGQLCWKAQFVVPAP